MKPGSFDYETCREFIGEAEAARLEKRAREDADNGECRPPIAVASGKWLHLVEASMRTMIYMHQYSKRKLRNLRKKK